MNVMYTEANQTGIDDTAINGGSIDRVKFCPDATIIKNSALGDELTIRECELLAAIMNVRHLAPGERLVNQGDRDTRLFLLAAGTLAVITGDVGQERHIYTMTRGECRGTRAFIDNTPRKASLQAIDAATVYTLKPESIEELVKTDADVAYKFMRALFRVTHANLMRVKQEREQLANYISHSGGRY